MSNAVESKRLGYLDIAKGIGIITVVWFHAKGFASQTLIYLVLAMFFLISGFFHNTSVTCFEFIKRKFFRLYLPFVLCNLIWPSYVVIYRLLAGLPVKQNFLHMLQIVIMWKKDGFLFGATWFLVSLFLISISVEIVIKLLRNDRYKYILATILFGGISVVSALFFEDMDMGLRRGLIYSFYYSLGLLVKIYSSEFKSLVNNKYVSVASLLLLGFVSYYLYINNIFILGYKKYYSFALYTYSIIGSILIIKMSEFLYKKEWDLSKVLLFFGRNSIYILIWHFVFFAVITAILLNINGISLVIIDRLPHVISENRVILLIYFFVGLLGPIGIVLPLKKLWDFINYKLKSN